ncbi:DNA repair protein RecO [Candidatus Lucifugimonas marina]|jgi:DNA repair protein RecO (recombination protein O)|uniref:DNA repair protein RecO n=1 Tax=Candidatus Lucifugimonas marina TaxID=3038979 RepID=A0AAJ5ZFY3_9CHLR|nr:DNA repair protein RecO [SAR202 cluster bacterium JH702]MDG0869361.1 DNA repair protein RecO [SAR202 cluster bacterium JH639]WFG36758.1 DNA repair protein RecO [SAR202 cluster bacterium JH545]WFG40692.1 DNA repair protein RecO [SAR202 cluster bacterium JH1073]
MTSKRRPVTYTTDGVVVRTSNLGEADRIITLITPVHGIVRGVAKAARKPGSKVGGHLDLLKHVSVSVRETRTLHGLSQASTLNGFRGLRDDLDRFSRASYISEMSERFSVENGANQPLFRLLLDTLESLEVTTNPEMIIHFFEMRLLQLSGFSPELSRCVETGVDLEPANHLYSADRGGLVNSDARPVGESALLPASLNTIKLLRFLSRTDIAQAGVMKAGEDENRQLSRILRAQIHHVLDRGLRSEAFMDEVRTRPSHNDEPKASSGSSSGN